MALHDLSQRELEKRLKEAREKGGITKIADGSNLYLVVRPTGSPSWQLKYQWDGLEKTYSIGTYPTVTLSSARQLAQKARELIQAGQNPVEARRKARVPTETPKTVAQIIETWLEMNKSEWGETHYDDFVQASNKNVLPYIGSRLARSITPDDIRTVLERVEKRGANYMLTRVRSMLQRAFELAVDTSKLEVNPVMRVKRATFAAHKDGHHPAIVEPAALSVLLKKLDEEESTLPIIALRLNALVFVRPQNLRFATWDQFDLDAATWLVPDDQMKMDRAFLVPLAKQTVALLKNLRTITKEGPMLFPSPVKLGNSYGDTTFMKNLHRLGYKGIHSTHGFRTTAKTLLEEGGFDSKYTEKQLAHEEPNKVKRAYNRAEYWHERVRMMQAWADYIDALRTLRPQESAPLPWTWFADWREKQSTPPARSEASSTLDRSSTEQGNHPA